MLQFSCLNFIYTRDLIQETHYCVKVLYTKCSVSL